MKKVIILLVFGLAIQLQAIGQTASEILTNTKTALGTELLVLNKTMQYDLTQKREGTSQQYRITVKGNNKIRADISGANGAPFSLVRNGSEYRMEVGAITKEVTSNQTKKNLNRQNMVKGFLKSLDIANDATLEEQVTESGRQLFKVKSEEGNKKSVLLIDSETWLPVRHRETITRNNGKKLITVTVFKDYQDFEGIKIPTKQVIKITMPNGTESNEQYLLENINIGIEVTNKFFAAR